MVFLNDIKDILYNMLEKNKNFFSILNYIISTNSLNNVDKISLLLYSYSNNIIMSEFHLSNYFYIIKNNNKLLTEFENIYNSEYHNKMNFKDFQDFKIKVLETKFPDLDKYR